MKLPKPLVFIVYLLFSSAQCEELLPGYNQLDVNPQMNIESDKMRFGFGTVRERNYGQNEFMMVPLGNDPSSPKMKVPKAFYHYTERELGGNSHWTLPEKGNLLKTNSMLRNNQKSINGMYLPIANMDPINLHFITQRTFEKGLDTRAHDESPSTALATAKRICDRDTESACEQALLNYHRKKAQMIKTKNAPLHRQLINMADIGSDTRMVDRETEGLGLVVGVPGYEPLYVGATLGQNEQHRLKFKFSPP